MAPRLLCHCAVVAKRLDVDPTPSPETGTAILVADDEPQVRHWLAALLERNGYAVATTPDGVAALKLLASRDFQLLLLDLHMPALDGFGVIARIRVDERLRDLPIVVVSGSADDTLKVASLDCGANDFLSKPFTSVELLARIRAHLRVHEASRRWREGCLCDPLTGLANRRGILEALHRAVARAERESAPLALLYIDLDGFKAVNDRLGHRAGDELLSAFGKLVGGLCRAGDVAGRVGGDEFVIVLPGVSHRAACQVAARVHSAIARIGLSASIGVASLLEDVEPTESDAVAALIDTADAAMYRHKRSLGGDARR